MAPQLRPLGYGHLPTTAPTVSFSGTMNANAAVTRLNPLRQLPLPSSRADADSPLSLVEPPFPRELEQSDAMVEIITRIVDRLASLTRAGEPKLPDWAHMASVFFSVKIPEITIRSYVSRLYRYAQCTPAAFIVALIYMDRLASSDPTLALSDYNLHRLLITSVCVAAKFLDDRCFSNAHYARVGGIPSISEMNRLEIHFIKLLDFKLFVTSKDYFCKQTYALDLLRYSPPVILEKPRSLLSFSSVSSSPFSAYSPPPTNNVAFSREVSPVSIADHAHHSRERSSSNRPMEYGHQTHEQTATSQPTFFRYDNTMKQSIDRSTTSASFGMPQHQMVGAYGPTVQHPLQQQYTLQPHQHLFQHPHPLQHHQHQSYEQRTAFNAEQQRTYMHGQAQGFQHPMPQGSAVFRYPSFHKTGHLQGTSAQKPRQLQLASGQQNLNVMFPLNGSQPTIVQPSVPGGYIVRPVQAVNT